MAGFSHHRVAARTRCGGVNIAKGPGNLGTGRRGSAAPLPKCPTGAKAFAQGSCHFNVAPTSFSAPATASSRERYCPPPVLKVPGCAVDSNHTANVVTF
jgi:hypothetical protein